MDRAKVKVAERRRRKRQSFTPTQAAIILAHVDATADRRTIDWWLPVLAAFTGARREELGQLRVGDVAEIDGILCLRITDEGEGQKLKNAHSHRIIPVPQTVLARGFADYVAKRRAEGGVMLWRELSHDKQHRQILREIKADARGRFTEEYGKRFTRYVRQPLGLMDPATVFHSFRHTWTDAARKAGIDPEIRRLLAGRLDGEDLVESSYGSAGLIREKAVAMEKVACFVVHEPGS